LGVNALYVPESDAGASAILFLRDGALFAQRFDGQRLELRGSPVQLAAFRQSRLVPRLR
jgi:hypothetical protein